MKKRAERTMTKTAFILSLPKDTPAKQVVAKGKENGMEMSEAYVHAIRSAARRSKKGGKGKAGAGRKAAAARGGRRRGPAPSKREFILSLPSSTPVADVVAEGAKRGIKISAHYVYNLRSNASKGARNGATTRGRARSWHPRANFTADIIPAWKKCITITRRGLKK